MTLLLPRRKFLFGLTGVFAAPAIVRADRLMRVASIPDYRNDLVAFVS